MHYIDQHIERSFKRLSEEEYQIQHLFRPASYDWPGDWEGRALLAFSNLYAITGKKIPAMEQFVAELPDHLNPEGFLGEVFHEDAVNEQQLSGHGWLMCGLCEYYKLFKSEAILQIATKMFHNLFYRALPHYDHYPMSREARYEGEVSGTLAGSMGGWILSTDIGCAFICLDGISRYYEITKDPKAEEFLRKTIVLFMQFDKIAAKAQTHATLTAARAIFRFYKTTGDAQYLAYVKNLFKLYVEEGMTYTYENFNWFDRKDTWTEPCAIVDSLIVSIWLYEETKDESYKTLARRIWFNGLSFCHRVHGGAGPNNCVCEIQPYLAVNMYEAPFCCTMRYNEGLLFVHTHREWFENPGDGLTKDELGRTFNGDVLVVTDEETGKQYLLTELCFPEDNGKKYRVY